MTRSNSILQLRSESPGPHQAAAWREAVAPFWSFAIRKEDVADFRGQSRVHHLGNGILCRASASGLRFERNRTLVARMGVDHILAHVRLSGHARVTIGGERDCAPGDICLFDLSRPLFASSSAYEALTVVLPRPLFGVDQGALDALHGTVIQGESPFGRMLNTHLRALSAHAPGFSEGEAEGAARATAVLLGAAARGVSEAGRSGALLDGAPLLLVMRRFIEAELASPDLNAETLSRRFGVSRSALYRLFAPLGGVAGYVRQRRLDRAHRELAVGDGRFVRISEVAYRWGFESPAHFAQAFRAAFGCAPRDVRGHSAGAAVPDPSPRPETWTDFYDWVLRLAA